jgi:ketosteroid isomerase-like protein
MLGYTQHPEAALNPQEFLMKNLLVALVLLATTAVLAQSPASAPEKDKDAVKATLIAMWDALGKGDLDRYASYLHPDFTSFGENDVYLNVGKEFELRTYAEYLKTAKNLHTDMHQPEVTIRGDVAWITYYWSEGADIDGKRVTSRGKSTRIFVKEGGKWLCIHGHYTTVP